MNNMDYRKMIKSVVGLMGSNILGGILSISALGGACMGSYADECYINGGYERYIDRDEPLFKEIEDSFGETVREAVIRTSESGRLTGITAETGPIASYLCLCQSADSGVRVPSYQSLLEVFEMQALPSEATYKGVMENGKIQGEGEEKAYVAVYEGTGNDSNTLIILTKANEKYSVEIDLTLFFRSKGVRLLGRSCQETKDEKVEPQKASCEESYLGQHDGWRIYVCPDGGARGDYMTGRKVFPDYKQYEVYMEDLCLVIRDEEGMEYLLFIVKSMLYELRIMSIAAD